MRNIKNNLTIALYKGETSSSHCLHNWPVTREIRNSGSFKVARLDFLEEIPPKFEH